MKDLRLMAQAEMRNFDLLLQAPQNNVLIAPVKLQRITCLKVQGNIGMQQFSIHLPSKFWTNRLGLRAWI